MALRPDIESVLARMASAQAAPAETMHPHEVRALREEMMVARLAGVTPDPVASVEDLEVPGPLGPIPVRVYRPVGEPTALVVYLHGGGWCMGSIATYDFPMHTVCHRLGATVASVGYRLAPEHKFPEPLEDCWAATLALAARVEELAPGAGRLVVAGDSAGGNLAAAVTLRARDQGGPHVDAQLLVYPVTDATMSSRSYVENATGYQLTASMMAWCWDHYADEEARLDPRASVLHVADVSGLPPAVVVTAEFDPLRDEGELYAQRLVDAGVPVTQIRFDGMIHGFVGLIDLAPSARDALERTCDALRARVSPPAASR